jgi:hypothetical protein
MILLRQKMQFLFRLFLPQTQVDGLSAMAGVCEEAKSHIILALPIK